MRVTSLPCLFGFVACLASPGLAAVGAPPSPEQVTVPPPPSAARIGYNLASTSLKFGIDLTLESCSPFVTTAKVTVSSSVGPSIMSDEYFGFDAKALQSFLKDKNLAIDTYPHGTIKSLNGGLTDQTGSVITSLVKIAGSVVGLAGAPSLSAAGLCTKSVTDALDRVSRLRGKIKALRPSLESSNPVAITQAQTAIDVLAAEIARLRTEDLNLVLTKEAVPTVDDKVGRLAWTRADLAKWLKPDEGTADNEIAEVMTGFCIEHNAAVIESGGPECSAKIIDTPAGVGTAPVRKGPACPDDEKCSRTIVLREPVKATISVIALTNAFKDIAVEASLKRYDLLITQWGDYAYLPMTIGFGKSATFAMGFDESGHKVSQSWTSKSRAASLVGSAQAITDAAAGVYKTIDGQALAEKTAELTALKTQKELNQLRFCKTKIDEGGFTCPSE